MHKFREYGGDRGGFLTGGIAKGKKRLSAAVGRRAPYFVFHLSAIFTAVSSAICIMLVNVV